MSKTDQPSCRMAILSTLVLSMIVGCQMPGGMRSPLAQSSRGKKSWTSRIAKSLKPGKKEGVVDPVDQELALARSLEVQGKIAEAIYTYSTILAKDDISKGKRAEAHHRLAVLHDKGGKFQSSEEHYEEALKLDSKNSELLCDRGYSCMLQGRMEEAEKNLEAAIQRDPEILRAHNNLGLLLARQGKIDRALVEFAAAGCSHAEARTNVAYAMTVDGKVAEAELQLQLARQADASLAAADELESALRQLTGGESVETDSARLVVAQASMKPVVVRSRNIQTVSSTRLIDAVDAQVVAAEGSELGMNSVVSEQNRPRADDSNSSSPAPSVEPEIGSRAIEPVRIQAGTADQQQAKPPVTSKLKPVETEPAVEDHRTEKNQLSVLNLEQLYRPMEEVIAVDQAAQAESTIKSSEVSTSDRSELVFGK